MSSSVKAIVLPSNKKKALKQPGSSGTLPASNAQPSYPRPLTPDTHRKHSSPSESRAIHIHAGQRGSSPIPSPVQSRRASSSDANSSKLENGVQLSQPVPDVRLGIRHVRSTGQPVKLVTTPNRESFSTVPFPDGSISVNSESSYYTESAEAPMIVQAEDIIALTFHVKTFAEALSSLRNTFIECKDNPDGDPPEVKAHERLGKVLSVLKRVLKKYQQLHSTEIIALAGTLLNKVKIHNYEDTSEAPDKFYESIDQLALAFSSSVSDLLVDEQDVALSESVMSKQHLRQEEPGFESGQKITAPATMVPSEINLRGRLALEAYNKALAEGKTFVKRVPVMLVGQDHSGKTSLKNSLMGKPFNRDEDSTVGIHLDPSHFKVTTEIWKTGDNDQAAQAEQATSYEHHAARFVAEHLKEEKNVHKSMKSHSIPRSVPALTVLPDLSSVRNQRRKEHSPHALPKIPEEIESLIKKLLQEVEKVENEEDIYSVLWDFGGQSVYYATHPLFITAKAMYVLVYDLSRDPHERARPVVKQGRYKKMFDDHDTRTNLDYLNFWMTSIAALASQDQQVHSGPVQVNIPPVFLVCTHADEPCYGADPSELAREVFGSLHTKPYKNHLYKDVFVVDNTKSGTESECSEVARLREKVLHVARELPQMKEVIPIKWLRYEKALEGKVKEGRQWISLETAKQIASQVCNIDDEKDFFPLLNFLHDRRIVVHFDDPPVLNDLVVLDPQWLVSVFKEVITVKPFNRKETEYEELWERLQSTGILEETLLEHVWGPLLDKKETSASLIKIMEKFSLLCEWPSSDASCGKQYLVPSVLMSHPPQFIIKLVASAQIPSLFLKFEFGQVPPGLFPRLVLQFFQWGQGEFWSSQNPQLYRNFARFYTSGDEDCSVILWCHCSSIEIVVHRDRLDMAESLQSKLNISAHAHYDAFEVACARAIHRQLGLMLECIRNEFCWLKNMKYEEGFICSVCCQGHVVKLCYDHHKEGCEQEECLHFWSVSDLRVAKPFVRCCKCATAQSNKIRIKQFAPWIETADEQPTTDEDDESLLAPEGGNDEKLLTLPSEALKSLFLQPCDSKEVVLQLTQILQLDRDTLEQPDPGTKRSIRCLATKAKQSNRLDVVKHLREITPAGTTGPLLPECLDIQNIPVRQVTDLTVELSGGEEWKLLAEELGLTPQEIRYLDSRIQNPCEAVLAYSAKNRYISVGCLYDKLIKCGLPMAADRL